MAGLRRWARLAATAPEGVFPMLIKADQSCLMVIDVQERLVPAMQAPARVIRNTRTP